MATVKKTLKERRTESDARILESAIKHFGEHGYTNTSLVEIAKGAGVTSGLLSQRYGTKENLFYISYEAIVDKFFTDIQSDVTPRECLCALIGQIKRICEEDQDAFAFFIMLQNSSDIHDIVEKGLEKRGVENSIYYKKVLEAQKEGMLPQGRTRYLLYFFSSSVFHHVGMCKEYNLKLPDNEYYLSIIHFHDKDTPSDNNAYIRNQLLDIFSKEFQTVWLVKLPELTMETFSVDNNQIVINSVSTALEMNSYNGARKWYVDNCVVPHSKERVYRDSDMSNVLSELKNGKPYSIEYGRIKEDSINYNQIFYDKVLNPENDEIDYVVCGFRDIDVAKRAETDDLTGLYTRPTFFEKAEELLDKYPDKQFDMVISDIADFKKINETYGIEVADEILRWHALYLLSLKNETMIVGRYGGDQMVFMAEHEHMLTCLSQEYREKFEKAFLETGLPTVSFKHGIYLNVKRDKSIVSTCDKAHSAVNSIKRHYSKEIAYYDDDIKSILEKRRQIEESMHKSLEDGDFKVYYQPKHNAKTGALVGAEALIRWVHPKFGFMNPGEFIPLFEQNGFIIEVDAFVWRKTCENIRKWRDKGLETVPVSVNASRLTFTKKDLVDNMHKQVEKNGILSSDIHVEITETLMTVDLDELVSKIDSMRLLGFKVELDDFGSGFSSMNALSTIPLDIVKLDMSFMRQFGDKKRLMVLESCINLAKKLGFETVSEGVEEKEQQELLAKLGVDMIQGYYYSKPLPEEEFEKYMMNK